MTKSFTRARRFGFRVLLPFATLACGILWTVSKCIAIVFFSNGVVVKFASGSCSFGSHARLIDRAQSNVVQPQSIFSFCSLPGPVIDAPRYYVLPISGIFIILLSATVALVWRHWQMHRPQQGSCSSCGYDLTGNESGVCSECGHVIRHERAVPTRLGQAKDRCSSDEPM